MRKVVFLTPSAIVLFCLTTLLTSSPLAQSQTSPSLPSDSSLIWVAVTDEQGNYQTQFAQRDFRLVSNGAPQEITFFSKDHNQPVSAVFLVDRTSRYWGTVAPATPLSAMPGVISSFLAQFPPKSEFSVMGFQEKPEIIVDWTGETEKIATQVNDLTTVKSKNAAKLYDACKAAIEQTQKGQHSKRIIILLSQGLEEAENSQTRPRELKRILKGNDALMYVIDLGPDEYVTSSSGGGAFHSEEYIEPRFFKDLANLTGGKVFHPRSLAGLKWTLGVLSTDLHCQYALGFNLPGLTSDKYYKLGVSLQPTAATLPKNLKLSIRHREGLVGSPKK